MSVPKPVTEAKVLYNWWLDVFKPYDAENNLAYYEINDENREYIKTIDPHLIWTETSGSEGQNITSGFWDHYDVFGWYICQKPWSGEPGARWFRLEVWVNCKNCRGDGQTPTGRLCKKCEGRGGETFYVD